MGLATTDAFVKALTNGRKQEFRFTKDGQAANETPEAAGNWVSLFLAPGSPAAGTAPTTSWADFDNGNGSMIFTDVSPQKRYLYSVDICSTVPGVLMVFDLLGHRQTAANALASTGDKTISAVLPARMTGAEAEDKHNVEAWIAIATATNTNVVQLSMNSYTDSDGNSGAAGGTLIFPAAATNIGWMSPLPMAAGDRGVQAINTINVSVAAASTGTANVMLIRPIAFVPVAAANIMTTISIKDGLIPRRIYDDSSLCLAWFATSTTVPDIWGSVVCAYDGA